MPEGSFLSRLRDDPATKDLLGCSRQFRRSPGRERGDRAGSESGWNGQRRRGQQGRPGQGRRDGGRWRGHGRGQVQDLRRHQGCAEGAVQDRRLGQASDQHLRADLRRRAGRAGLRQLDRVLQVPRVHEGTRVGQGHRGGGRRRARSRRPTPGPPRSSSTDGRGRPRSRRTWRTAGSGGRPRHPRAPSTARSPSPRSGTTRR